MIIKIISLFLALAAVAVYIVPLRPPSWQRTTLGTKGAERFVALATMNNSPIVAWFDASSEGGVLVKRPESTSLSILNSLKLYLTKGVRNWVGENPDKTRFTGLFLSGAGTSDRAYLSYQEGNLGEEKLMLSSFDGTRWTKEVADDVSNGLKVGMYTSLSIIKPSTPIIFYHTEQGRKFGFALRTNNPSSPTKNQQPASNNWSRRTLETGTGLLTDTVSCGNSVFAAYRSRDTDDIHLGTLDYNNYNGYNDYKNYKWTSRALEASTSSGLAITAVTSSNGCLPYLSYFDDKTSNVIFLNTVSGEKAIVGRGYNSRISLAADKSGFLLLYPSQEGLTLARSTDGRKWTLEILDPDRRAGSYNSLKTSDRGDIYLAYIAQNQLKYEEYQVSALEDMKKAKTILALLLFTLSASLIFNLKFKIFNQ